MDAFARAESIRRCPSVSDQQWVQMGIERALEDSQSGRDFIQNWNLSHLDQAVDFSQFFGIQRSARRLKLVREVNTLVASAMPAHMHSMIDHFPELDGFDIYAGDGHYIGASTHETLVQGKRRPVGHFYTLDLRSHGLTYLTGTDLERMAPRRGSTTCTPSNAKAVEPSSKEQKKDEKCFTSGILQALTLTSGDAGSRAMAFTSCLGRRRIWYSQSWKNWKSIPPSRSMLECSQIKRCSIKAQRPHCD